MAATSSPPLERGARASRFDRSASPLLSFVREMKVLVVAGTWCGDCVNQCPIFEHFAAKRQNSHPLFDRDENKELAQELSICGGPRVPSLLFLSEDGFPLRPGRRPTISTYRDIAARQLGPSCPTGIAPPDKTLLQNVVQDWLNEFDGSS